MSRSTAPPRPHRPNLRLGLTGGIGSGKTEVAKILAGLGAFVIDTDALAREAVLPGSPAIAAIAREWPSVVRDGALDRAALADIVFSNPAARERLNAIVHPEVRRLAAQREEDADPGQVVIHVVPLLFETGYAAGVDGSILVIAPQERRIDRVVARDATDAAHVLARMEAQMSPDDACARADYIITNDGDLATLRERTRKVYEAITS